MIEVIPGLWGKASCSKDFSIFKLGKCDSFEFVYSSLKKKAAFTLAEVLITLGIIGVVAAMTLPTLIQNHQKQVLLTQLKKNYAILTQAVSMLKAEYDNVDPVQMPFVQQQWDHKAYLKTELLGPEFAKYLPIVSSKADPDAKMCFDSVDDWNVKYGNGNLSNKINFYISNDGDKHWTWELNNGACIHFSHGSAWEWTDSTPHRFIIDVNGSKKNPNQSGKDIFMFDFKPDGKLIPTMNDLSASEQLNDWNGCKKSGLGCAAMIMKNGWSYPKDYPAWK